MSLFEETHQRHRVSFYSFEPKDHDGPTGHIADAELRAIPRACELVEINIMHNGERCDVTGFVSEVTHMIQRVGIDKGVTPVVNAHTFKVDLTGCVLKNRRGTKDEKPTEPRIEPEFLRQLIQINENADEIMKEMLSPTAAKQGRMSRLAYSIDVKHQDGSVDRCKRLTTSAFEASVSGVTSINSDSRYDLSLDVSARDYLVSDGDVIGVVTIEIIAKLKGGEPHDS